MLCLRRQWGGAPVTTALAAIAGFALSQLLGWIALRALSWATDRAERDPYFCREYARPRSGAVSARAPTAATRNGLDSAGSEVKPFSQGGV